MRNTGRGWFAAVTAMFFAVVAMAADGAKLGYDGLSLMVDGKRSFLISGEFHYFRVPKGEWRRRLKLLKDVGGNCVATYVP